MRKDYERNWKYSVLIHDISDGCTKNANLCSVYFMYDGQFVKIGVADDVYQRINNIQTSNARKIELLAYKPYKTKEFAFKAEKNLHNFFKEYRLNGEWFDIAEERYFEALMRSNHVEKGRYAKNKKVVQCVAVDEYGNEPGEVIDLSNAIKKMRSFYHWDEAVM